MGDYTDFDFTCRVNERFKEVEHLFTHEALCGDFTDEQEEARNVLWAKETHPFFRKSKADFILTLCTVNMCEHPAMTYKDGAIEVHTSFKNVGDTIEQFFDWISPYLDLSTLNGTYKFENWYNEVPLIVKNGKIDVDWDKADRGQDGPG